MIDKEKFEKATRIDEPFDIRSRILETFPYEFVYELYKIYRFSTIAMNNIKHKRVINLLDSFKIRYHLLGYGTNRIAVLINGYVFKLAVDDRAILDNFNEYALSKQLQPYVAKSYEINKYGLILVQEYIRPLTPEEFENKGMQSSIRAILNKLSSNYLLDDVGYSTKNIVNWGYRESTKKLVILDYAYVFISQSVDMICDDTANDPQRGKVLACGGYLHYDEDFTHLLCSRCKKKYSVYSIREKVSKKFFFEFIHATMDDRFSYTVTQALTTFTERKLDFSGDIYETKESIEEAKKEEEANSWHKRFSKRPGDDLVNVVERPPFSKSYYKFGYSPFKTSDDPRALEHLYLDQLPSDPNARMNTYVCLQLQKQHMEEIEYRKKMAMVCSGDYTYDEVFGEKDLEKEQEEIADAIAEKIRKRDELVIQKNKDHYNDYVKLVNSFHIPDNVERLVYLDEPSEGPTLDGYEVGPTIMVKDGKMVAVFPDGTVDEKWMLKQYKEIRQQRKEARIAREEAEKAAKAKEKGPEEKSSKEDKQVSPKPEEKSSKEKGPEEKSSKEDKQVSPKPDEKSSKEDKGNEVRPVDVDKESDKPQTPTRGDEGDSPVVASKVATEPQTKSDSKDIETLKKEWGNRPFSDCEFNGCVIDKKKVLMIQEYAKMRKVLRKLAILKASEDKHSAWVSKMLSQESTLPINRPINIHLSLEDCKKYPELAAIKEKLDRGEKIQDSHITPNKKNKPSQFEKDHDPKLYQPYTQLASALFDVSAKELEEILGAGSSIDAVLASIEEIKGIKPEFKSRIEDLSYKGAKNKYPADYYIEYSKKDLDIKLPFGLSLLELELVDLFLIPGMPEYLIGNVLFEQKSLMDVVIEYDKMLKGEIEYIQTPVRTIDDEPTVLYGYYMNGHERKGDKHYIFNFEGLPEPYLTHGLRLGNMAPSAVLRETWGRYYNDIGLDPTSKIDMSRLIIPQYQPTPDKLLVNEDGYHNVPRPPYLPPYYRDDDDEGNDEGDDVPKIETIIDPNINMDEASEDERIFLENDIRKMKKGLTPEFVSGSMEVVYENSEGKGKVVKEEKLEETHKQEKVKETKEDTPKQKDKNTQATKPVQQEMEEDEEEYEEVNRRYEDPDVPQDEEDEEEIDPEVADIEPDDYSDRYDAVREAERRQNEEARTKEQDKSQDDDEDPDDDPDGGSRAPAPKPEPPKQTSTTGIIRRQGKIQTKESNNTTNNKPSEIGINTDYKLDEEERMRGMQLLPLNHLDELFDRMGVNPNFNDTWGDRSERPNPEHAKMNHRLFNAMNDMNISEERFNEVKDLILSSKIHYRFDKRLIEDPVVGTFKGEEVYQDDRGILYFVYSFVRFDLYPDKNMVCYSPINFDGVSPVNFPFKVISGGEEHIYLIDEDNRVTFPDPFGRKLVYTDNLDFWYGDNLLCRRELIVASQPEYHVLLTNCNARGEYKARAIAHLTTKDIKVSTSRYAIEPYKEELKLGFEAFSRALANKLPTYEQVQADTVRLVSLFKFHALSGDEYMELSDKIRKTYEYVGTPEFGLLYHRGCKQPLPCGSRSLMEYVSEELGYIESDEDEGFEIDWDFNVTEVEVNETIYEEIDAYTNPMFAPVEYIKYQRDDESIVNKIPDNMVESRYIVNGVVHDMENYKGIRVVKPKNPDEPINEVMTPHGQMPNILNKPKYVGERDYIPQPTIMAETIEDIERFVDEVKHDDTPMTPEEEEYYGSIVDNMTIDDLRAMGVDIPYDEEYDDAEAMLSKNDHKIKSNKRSKEEIDKAKKKNKDKNKGKNKNKNNGNNKGKNKNKNNGKKKKKK